MQRLEFKTFATESRDFDAFRSIGKLLSHLGVSLKDFQISSEKDAKGKTYFVPSAPLILEHTDEQGNKSAYEIQKISENTVVYKFYMNTPDVVIFWMKLWVSGSIVQVSTKHEVWGMTQKNWKVTQKLSFTPFGSQK